MTAQLSADQQWIASQLSAIKPTVQATRLYVGDPPDDFPTICLVENPDAALGVFDAETETIVLRRDLPNALGRGVLLHELRHAEQYRRGFCPSNAISMEANARAVAALEADASAYSLLAAWEMAEMGEPEVWNALEAWDLQSDIAKRFAREMESSRDLTKAVTVAFAQWYESEARWRAYYVSSCSDFLDRQDASHLLPSYKNLPDDFLNNLCVMADGSEYPCDDVGWNPRGQ